MKRSGGIEPIIIGAAYSYTQEVDTSFVAEVSSSSPLFNFPVETVQRGRDHGEHWRGGRRGRGAVGAISVRYDFPQ